MKRFVILLLLLISSISYGYTADSYDDIQSTLGTDYVADSYDNIISILGEEISFLISLNSPVDNYNTTDNTQDFNFTVSGNTETYSCELFINETGYGTIEDSWCYQETANVSTACGGLDTGTYSFSGSWSSESNLYDGSWNTYGRTIGGASYMYINYSSLQKPINDSKIIVKIGSFDPCERNLNITVSTNCNRDIVEIKILSNQVGSFWSTTVSCWNGTGWEDIKGHCQSTSSASGYIWEEGMWWHVLDVSNNTATVITANATVPDGTYNWYINCTIGETTNSSETRTINIDTILPQIEFVNPTEANNTNITVNYTYVNWTVIETNQDTMIFNWNGSNSTVTDTYINKTNLAEGIYTYYVWINDTFGFENQTDVRTIKIDTIHPDIIIYSPTNTTYWDISEVDLNVSADETVDTWWYELNSNGTNVTFTPNTTINVIDGQNNIVVWVNDTSGNENSSTLWFYMKNTTITVNYTSGDDMEFATTSYHGTFPIIGQNDTTAGVNITNLGNIILDVNITVNTSYESCFTFWMSNDSTLDTTTDYNVTDTMQTFITDLAINESIYFWGWIVFNLCTPGYEYWYTIFYDPFES